MAIPLPNVTSNVLKKVRTQRSVPLYAQETHLTPTLFCQVLEYCGHHRNDPAPPADEAEESRKRTTDISEWDSKFISVDQEMLFEIILAANYLDIKPLLDVGCKTV